MDAIRKRWSEIQAKREAYLTNNPHPISNDNLFCPFTDNGDCVADCQDNENRICINGDDICV